MTHHIAIVGNGIGAFTPFRTHFISELLRIGYRVSALLPCQGIEQGQLKKALAIPDLDVYPVNFNAHSMDLLSEVRAYRSIASCLSTLKPNSIMNITVKPSIYGSLAAKKLGIKSSSLFTGLGYLFSDPSLPKKIITKTSYPLFRYALSNNQRVIFHNKDDLDLFLGLRLIRSEQAALVPGSGVDIFEFAPKPIPTKKIKFLMISRLLKDKGIFEFIQAANSIKSSSENVEFIHIGGETNNPNRITSEELKAKNPNQVVKFIGPVCDVRPFISEASVIVLPSYREGLSRSLLEGMSMGRPIITTDAAGCHDLIQHGSEGLVVQRKSSQKLAEAMNFMIKNPATIPEMGAKAGSRVVRLHNVHSVTNNLIQVLDLPSLNRELKLAV